MTGDLVAGWGITPPPGHPVIAQPSPSGRALGAACGCGGWQAYMGSPEAARAARLSYEEHLRRTGASYTPA